MEWIDVSIGLPVALLALVAEFIDSSLGMGYGTALAPILLLLGFPVEDVVPAVLISELATGLLAGLAHHRAGNADFAVRPPDGASLGSRIHAVGVFRALKESASRPLKVALVLGLIGPVGLGVMLVASAIGFIPVLWGSRRMNAMGILLLPIALDMVGLGDDLARWLGLL